MYCIWIWNDVDVFPQVFFLMFEVAQLMDVTTKLHGESWPPRSLVGPTFGRTSQLQKRWTAGPNSS